jgi:hypothetical protein
MLMRVIAGGDAPSERGPSARPTRRRPRPEARPEHARDDEDVAPLQGPAASLRAVGGSGVLYLMPPAKPWMNFFCAKR